MLENGPSLQAKLLLQFNAFYKKLVYKNCSIRQTYELGRTPWVFQGLFFAASILLFMCDNSVKSTERHLKWLDAELLFQLCFLLSSE